MARAITARIQGDDYQAKWLWMQICRLFAPRTKVVRVSYEASGIKSFDDVVCHYEGMDDDEGNPLLAEYYQVKFHVSSAGALTWEAMINPAFINATSVSLLQRLKNAQQAAAPSGTEVHFILYSPWTVHPDDPLAEIHSQADGRLDLRKFSQGGGRSRFGKIRAAWRSHLSLDTDEDLFTVLRPFRLRQGPTLKELQDGLNARLQGIGLLPIEDGQLINPYDDLARRFIKTGKTEFTRADIQTICNREKLWMTQSIMEPNVYQIGIRSFLRWAESLEDETDRMLDLLRWFNGRHVHSPELWQTQIYPSVNEFLTALRPGQACHLHLHAHLSIAFAAGYCLDSKSGIDAAVVQSTRNGRVLWHPSPSIDESSYPSWALAEEMIEDAGTDVALAIALTHDNVIDVKAYIEQAQLPIRRIISITLPNAPNPRVIVDGNHAKLLADQLSHLLKIERTIAERQGRLHIFAAVPNGFMFFLGQTSRSFGRTTLYEYDFGTGIPGAYEASISFPPSARP